MGIEWSLERFGSWRFAAGAGDELRCPAARTAASTGLEGWMGCVLRRMERALTRVRDTRGVRVPKHAVGSRLDDDYELSTRCFRSTDLRRIC